MRLLMSLSTGIMLAIGSVLSMATISKAETALKIYVVTSTGNLRSFLSSDPVGTLSTSIPITGLESGETILAIDFRPLNKLLYGIGSTSRLYTINTSSGLASAVSSTPFTTLSGNRVGMDFNPSVDRIRVVTNANENLRLNPDTGALAATDTSLAYVSGDTNFGANPRVTAVAYSHNLVGTDTTTLMGIDALLGILVRQGGPASSPSPNGGGLSSLGALAGGVS